jgi:hypothetical protein
VLSGRRHGADWNSGAAQAVWKKAAGADAWVYVAWVTVKWTMRVRFMSPAR